MILPRSFYLRDTVSVARDLLGQELVCRTLDGEAAGVIVETEAYLGTGDPASHAFGGRRTPRTEILFAAGGRAYIYLVYGLHHCLNLTTGKAGIAECVLIRALQPTVGVELMQARQPAPRPERLAAGPGRLCRALGIGREMNGADLTGENLFVREGKKVAADAIATTPRIGVDYAGEARDWPLRFLLQGNPCVTRLSQPPHTKD
jgi:DNA-3-methyladenine glycosylase